jgi:hypothetical protein
MFILFKKRKQYILELTQQVYYLNFKLDKTPFNNYAKKSKFNFFVCFRSFQYTDLKKTY